MRTPNLSPLLAAVVLSCTAACHDSASSAIPPDAELHALKAIHVDAVPVKSLGPSEKPIAIRQATVLHTIDDGQTLWDIARAYGVSLKQLMDANGFSPADVRRLRKGVQLKVERTGTQDESRMPAARTTDVKTLPALQDGAYHVLNQGESLWTLARMYDVPMETLMARNAFTEDVYSRLRPGQPVIIPGRTASQIKKTEQQPAEPRSGLSHKLDRGETVWDIARRYHVSVGELMSANSLTAEQVQNMRDGQTLFLPGVHEDGRGNVQRDTTVRERAAGSVARGLGLGSLNAAGRLLHGQVESRWIAAAGGGNTLPGTLRWPLAQGSFVRGFGSGQGGYHKAMDIAGHIGWNVRAAAEGIVGYAGNKVPGFGNMVMVVHPGGWVTLYAHNSVNFVAAGQRVQKGSVLAEVGSTGRSQGPHVHFELIYDGKNCDPAPLFRPGVRHRSGKYSSIAYATWRNPSQKPRQIQCAKRQKHPMGAAVMNENPNLDQQVVDEQQTLDLWLEEQL
jgi:murein DD-endopeptidase MepM/ murein hydrolase activator NlpD